MLSQSGPGRDWAPDFRVTFLFSHSECGGSHTLLVAVLPFAQRDDCKRYPSLRHFYGINEAHRNDYKGLGVSINAGAVFGSSQKASTWEMSHGAGGGTEDVPAWVDHAESLWFEAVELVK